MQQQAYEQKTEQEMLSLMRENFRLASEACVRLANGERGPLYPRLRDLLKSLEDLCRKVGHNRGDTRWFPVGNEMNEAKERARRWVLERGSQWKLLKLGEKLAFYGSQAERLANQATGKSGPILPVVKEAPHRDTRPVAVPGNYEIRDSGLIVPTSGLIH